MHAIDPGRRRRRAAAALAALLLASPVALAGQGPPDSADGARRPALADIVVPAAPVLLPPLRVEARSSDPPAKIRGFDRRRRRHPAGVFVGRAEIERRDPRRVSDLLRGVAGITPGRPPAGVGRPRVRMDRTPVVPGRRSCRVRFFVDGMPVPKRGGFRIDDLQPDDVEAIEVYRGVAEVPPRFQRREDSCGTVVIWTRAPGTDRRR